MQLVRVRGGGLGEGRVRRHDLLHGKVFEGRAEDDVHDALSPHANRCDPGGGEGAASRTQGHSVCRQSLLQGDVHGRSEGERDVAREAAGSE